MLDCVRSDGKSVDLNFCREVGVASSRPARAASAEALRASFLFQLGLERKWQMNASCVVECPVNCQLSDWSPWSQCTHTCGLAGLCSPRFLLGVPPRAQGPSQHFQD